jgi:hypothetical protein
MKTALTILADLARLIWALLRELWREITGDDQTWRKHE